MNAIKTGLKSCILLLFHTDSVLFFVQLADSTWTTTTLATCKVGIRLPTPILKWIIGKPFSHFIRPLQMNGLPIQEKRRDLSLLIL